MRRSRGWLAIRLALTVSLFATGLSAGLACGFHSGPDRLTTTVTTNGEVTTIVTGP
jgi:hypothetical protein